MKRRSSGFVHSPIHKGSTVIYQSVAEMESIQSDPLKTKFPAYGRFGSPNAREFENEIAKLESGFAAVSTNSGLSAITTAIMSFVQSGDHILIVGSAYLPTKNFCDSLTQWNIDVEYYDPIITDTQLDALIRPNTRLVYFESPCSNTFEIQNIPSLAQLCRKRGLITIIDNTWATPLFFNPLQHGVDVCIHSATKYICGHSDTILGVIVCNEKSYAAVRQTAIRLGQCGNTEDAFLAVRGLQTLKVRILQHEQNAIQLAKHLEDRPEVQTVLHPALPSHPQHHLWKRDFRGSSGLFSFRLQPKYDKQAVIHFIESLECFGLGHSWGGVDSLLVPIEFNSNNGALLRLHVGLENIDDLISDISNGLNLLNQK